MATASKARRSFSTAAVTAATAESGAASPDPTVSTTQVSPNPRNTRRIADDSPGVLKIKESIEATGVQIEPSTVVTRTAYLSIFPEDIEAIGDAIYVQVTGGQRHRACVLLNRELRINVQDELAESRALFVTATAEENLKRADLNAIEEAEAVAQIVAEYGSQTAAAAARGWSQPWVSQRVSLLKLADSTKHAVVKYEVPVREVRNSLWKLPEQEQLAYIDRLVKARRSITAVIDEPDDEPATKPVPSQRVSPLARAVQRLHARPISEVGETLRAQLSADERREWAAELLKGL